MGIKFNVQLLGLEEIQDRLFAIRSSNVLQQTSARRLFADANGICNVGRQLCPVLTGNLRSTIHAQVPVINGDRVDCTFGCGGPAAPYGVYVHEDLTKRHKNGTAKFMDIPYVQYLFGGLDGFVTELRAAQIFGRSTRAVGRGITV